MNEYIVYVTGQDSIGYSFMKNVAELANKGAVLQEGKVPRLNYPHSAFFYLSTEELMESKPGFQFQIICEKFTKEQLEEMDWDTFKHTLKRQFGLGGRNREQMTREYLKAAFGDEVEAE